MQSHRSMCQLMFSDWYVALHCSPKHCPRYIFISTSMSKIGQAKPKRQLLFQSVTTSKFRPHPCIQQLKTGPRQQFRAEAQNRLCIFTSCIFSHYVMIFLHKLLSCSPSPNPVGPFFFFFCSCSLKYQCTDSLFIPFFLFQLNVFLIYDAVSPASDAASP